MIKKLSFVFPCLNEVENIENCIHEVQQLAQAHNLEIQIIVADNGSNDGTLALLSKLKVSIIIVAERGYGAALLAGFNVATCEWVAYADADGTYILSDLILMLKLADSESVDLVLANRFAGVIEKGAMPTLHRYIGTPVLTFLISFLFKGKVYDCNSGFRLIRRSSLARWSLDAKGMELATQMLVRALKNKHKILMVPSGLKCANPQRVPHLRTWRDGMRHLLLIFSECPQHFETVSLCALLVSVFFQLLSSIIGPFVFFNMSIFDSHSKLLFLFLSIIGLMVYLYSLAIYLGTSIKPKYKITQYLTRADEGFLFFISLVSFSLFAIFFLYFFFLWVKFDFYGIKKINELITVIHICLLPIILTSSLIMLNGFKRIAERR